MTAIRRRPGRWGGVAAVGGGSALLLLLAARLCGTETSAAPAPAVQGAENARALLAAVRGATPTACELAGQALAGHRGSTAHQEDAPAPGPEAEEVRRVVGWAQSQHKEPAAVPVLREGLRDADPCVRRTAARLLGRTRAPEAVDALLEALRAPGSAGREAALLGLAHADDPRAVAPLLEVLRAAEPELRGGAAWALGAIE